MSKQMNKQSLKIKLRDLRTKYSDSLNSDKYQAKLQNLFNKYENLSNIQDKSEISKQISKIDKKCTKIEKKLIKYSQSKPEKKRDVKTKSKNLSKKVVFDQN